MTGSAATFSDRFLTPLDRVRTAVFLRFVRIPWLRGLLLSKRRRIPALLLAHAGIALVLSVVSPTLLLMLGPLVLGVPHLVADVRYLVLKPALSRSTRALLLGGGALLLLVRALEMAGVRGTVRLELGVAAALTLGLLLKNVPRWQSSRVLAAGLLTLALGAAALVWPSEARLFLGHAHNVVALGIWAFLFCGSRARALGVASLILGLAVLLVTTPLAWWGFQNGLRSSFGLHVFAATDTLAPGVHDTTLALGIVASFAFLQSVHYAVWLHAIPQEATRGEVTRTFSRSYRALVSDFGKPALLMLAVTVIAVPALGYLAPLRTQTTYLSLAAFHAYLELAVLALFLARGSGGASLTVA
ncbi:MAG: hypothetical protein RJA70_1218 [Pseudomonadota bacterium]|jgi:hypothetical protein